MSLPRETIEQLLSGYMDDALSNAERDQCEELLRTDPAAAAELKELRRLRESLQFIARADSTLHLESGFIDRVLDATVQRARAEGLNEDHPVIRLSEQPSTSSTLRSSDQFAPAWRLTGMVAALAASVAIAFVFWGSNRSPETKIRSVANVDLIPESSELESPEPETALAENVTPETDPDTFSSEPVIDPSQNDLLVDAAIASSDRLTTEPKPSTFVESDPVANSKVAASDLKSETPTTPNMTEASPTMIASMPQRIVGAVMVLDISRTAAGRMSRAVRSAMRAAEIEIRNEKLIAKDIVGVLDSTQRNDDESLGGASVLYLEGTAKQLDRFIMSVCSDKQGIDAVQFGLASELPILNLLQKLQRPVDPKTVRHSASWSVRGDSPEASRLLSDALVDRTMVPLASNVAALGVIPGANEDGPDVMSELFVVVR